MKSQDVQEAISGLTVAGPKLLRLERIDAELQALQRQARSTRGLLPKGETTELLLNWLRARRDGFAAGSGDGPSVLRAVIGPLSESKRPRLINDEFELLVLWLLWPAIEANAAAAVAQLEYAEGLSSARRRQVAREIDTERTALLLERERLVDEVLAETGGTLQLRHLPETEQLRQREAERQAREAEIAARQALMAEAINQRHSRVVTRPREELLD